MFKYTARQDVLDQYERLQKGTRRPWDSVFYYAVGIVGTTAAYFACGDFWRHYRACEFYSKERRREIPINGVMVSVDWFTETRV